jgi:hypothetical protein
MHLGMSCSLAAKRGAFGHSMLLVIQHGDVDQLRIIFLNDPEQVHECRLAVTCSVQKASGQQGRKVYALGFHSLRRAFNTDLANSNVSQEIRQRLIGHASEEVNDRYTTIEMTTFKDAIHKLPFLETESPDAVTTNRERTDDGHASTMEREAIKTSLSILKCSKNGDAC